MSRKKKKTTFLLRIKTGTFNFTFILFAFSCCYSVSLRSKIESSLPARSHHHPPTTNNRQAEHRTLLHNIAHISRQQKKHTNQGFLVDRIMHRVTPRTVSSTTKEKKTKNNQASSHQTQDLIKTPGCERKPAGPLEKK